MPGSAFQVLKIGDNGRPLDEGLFKVDCGRTIIFRMRPGRIDLNTVVLWTNCPPEGGKFMRNSFRSIPGRVNRKGDGDWEALLKVTVPGSFEYYFTYHEYEGVTAKRKSSLEMSSWNNFMVDPVLCINGVPLPMSGVTLQTVITRCLGPIQHWPSALRATMLDRYTFVHFTPVQELGSSSSSYSIRDQLSLDPSLFAWTPGLEPRAFELHRSRWLKKKRIVPPLTADQLRIKEVLQNKRHELLERVLCGLEQQYGLLSMIDIVLNHTSTDTPWLQRHPSAGYTLGNSPHLTAAYELDEVMLKLSDEVANGLYEDDGVYAMMDSESAVFAVMRLLREQAIPEAKLWEYYEADIDQACAALSKVLPKTDDRRYCILENADMESLVRELHSAGCLRHDLTTHRCPIKLFNATKAAGILRQRECISGEERSWKLVDMLRKSLEHLNVIHHKRYEHDVESALNAMKGTALYMWLHEREGKESLSRDKPFVWSYFHEVDDQVFACNGFIWNGDPAIDFTMPVDVASQHAEAAARSNSSSLHPCDMAPAPGATTHLAKEEARVYGQLHDDAVQKYANTSFVERSRTVGKLLEAYKELTKDLRVETVQDTGKYEELVDLVEGLHSHWGQQGDVGAKESKSEPAGISSFRAIPEALWADGLVQPPLCMASTPYMRRDLVVWGDCVKLRYGSSPVSSPWLWRHMKLYVERMAAAFHAIRVDNAHGTPLHVAAAMTDVARAIRPNLFVCAELFTGRFDQDVLYTTQLGINALVRESLQSSSARELADHIYKHGGEPVASISANEGGVFMTAQQGSLEFKAVDSESPTHLRRLGSATGDLSEEEDRRTVVAALISDSAFQHHEEKLRPTPLPAMLYDCTHDNPAVAEKRDPVDALPNAALVAAAVCPAGSVRGYDILSPTNPSVVDEHRLYEPVLDSMRAFTIEEQLTHPPSPSKHPPIVATASASQLFNWDTNPNADSAETSSASGPFGFVGSGSGAKMQFPRGSSGSSTASWLEDQHIPWAGRDTGIRAARRILNSIRREMAENGFTQIHVHHYDVSGGDVVVVQRTHPITRDSYVFVCRTAFEKGVGNRYLDGPGAVELPLVTVEGAVKSVALAARLTVSDQGPISRPEPGPCHANPLGNYEFCDPSFTPREVVTYREGMVKEAPHRDEEKKAGLGALDGDSARGLPPAASSDPPHKDADLGVPVYPGAKWKPRRRMSADSSDLDDDSSVDEYSDSDLMGFQTSSYRKKLYGGGRADGASPHHMRHSALQAMNATSKASYHGGVYSPHPYVINGLKSVLLLSEDDASILCDVKLTKEDVTRIRLRNNEFWPGSVVVFRVQSADQFQLPIYHSPSQANLAQALPTMKDLIHALASPNVTLLSLNRLLYRCEPEELDDSHGNRGVYGIPDNGKLAWAGIAGTEGLLHNIRRYNDMGHPLLNNIRQGHWLMDYHYSRLAGIPELAAVREWMGTAFAVVRVLPSGLRPQAFDCVIQALFRAATATAVSRMSQFIRKSGRMARNLALTSVQLHSHTRSAPLCGVPLLVSDDGSSFRRSTPSLAAGLPHFSTGFMRNWGRDTFIALRGLMLVTGRYEEARDIILAFASVLRHGLIPNLMDGARNPRYNARDATWWYLQAVQDYCNFAPEGTKVLSAKVFRKFLSDDPREAVWADKNGMSVEPDLPGGDVDIDAARVYKSMVQERSPGTAAITPSQHIMTLGQVIHEIMERHAQGIHFREWNAGTRLDMHMKDEGFNVQVEVKYDTGLLHGGNRYNCGTWMDKMGESEEWGTKGYPATPRNGAPVEITGLLYSTLCWLEKLSKDKVLQYPGVQLRTGEKWSWSTWRAKVKCSFEHQYFIPSYPEEDKEYEIHTPFVHRRGYYKDTVGQCDGWRDYQLRPNQLVAMAVAPQLFDPDHARMALKNVEELLLGERQLGIKTLSPEDWAYRGHYNNNDTSSRETAKGWNYHQGPEWLWPYGYYLRARIRFFYTAKELNHGSTGDAQPLVITDWLRTRLKRQREHLESGKEKGLPELTNEQGSFCGDSCTVQAWSSSTLLDALYDLDMEYRA